MPPPRHLTPAQLRIYELLLQRVRASDIWVADCYIGGHSQLKLTDVPDAGSAAAHEFRDLLDNLWRIIPDFPKEEQKGTTDIVTTVRTQLVPEWEARACTRDTPPKVDLERIRGLGERAFSELMSVVHDVVLRVRAEQPVRAKLLRAVELADPSGIAVPETLREARRKQWLALRKSFVVACHGHRTPVSDIEGYAVELDDLLLEVLLPEGAESIAELDDLIAGVEGGSP